MNKQKIYFSNRKENGNEYLAECNNPFYKCTQKCYENFAGTAIFSLYKSKSINRSKTDGKWIETCGICGFSANDNYSAGFMEESDKIENFIAYYKSLTNRNTATAIL